MKKLNLISAIVLFLCTGPHVIAQKTELYPQTFFDSLQAMQMLGLGKSSIEGVAFTRTKNGAGMRVGQKMLAIRAVITLYPVTPYFEEWHDLRKKKEGKKTSVFMSQQAYRFRITVVSDDYGRFKFTEMKPGKYFIQAWANYSISGTSEVYRGSASNGWTTTNYYEYKNYTNNYSDRIEEFVEITRDGETIEIKLK